jgi:hypothetical protein
MKEPMKVRAAKGTQCPMEGKPRAYITDSKTVTVQATPYYLRLVRDGSLEIQAAGKPETKKKEQ